MLSLDNSANVFLVPAGSPEDQDILEATIQRGGLTRSDLELQADAESNSELTNKNREKLQSRISQREQLQQRLADYRSQQRDLQSKIENTGGYDTSETPKQQAQQTTEQDPTSLVGQEDEIEDEILDLEDELENVEEAIESLKEDQADEYDSVTPSVPSEALKAFEAVAGKKPDSDGVYCWPIQSSTKDQHQISSGDLFLFYRGSRVYRFAARVKHVKMSEALWRAIAPKSSEVSFRPHFVVFNDVVRIQLDSSVIADIAGHELDYPVGFSRLNESATKELSDGFGGLEAFVERAQKEGVNTRPHQTETDNFGEWLGDTSESSTTSEPSIDAKSGTGAATDPETQTGLEQDPNQSPTDVASTDKPTSSSGSDTAISDAEDDSVGSTPHPRGLKVSDLDGRKEWEVLRGLLEAHKLVKLVGPEQTGKRQFVHDLVENWFEDCGRLEVNQRVRWTNFHPDINFEEFILGGSRRGGTVDMLTGPLGDFVDLAAADTQQFVPQDDQRGPKYLLVIENFHLADPATVFGELWQSMRPDSRGKDSTVSISGTGSELWIPEQFYVIGIVDSNAVRDHRLNTPTASLFQTHQTAPDMEGLRKIYDVDTDSIEGSNLEFGAQSVRALEQLNDLIRESDMLGPRYALGQFHLSSRRDQLEPLDEVSLCEAWQYSVFPTLGGYKNNGLAKIGETILKDAVASADKPLSLGRIQSDVDLVRGIVETLAQQRSVKSNQN